MRLTDRQFDFVCLSALAAVAAHLWHLPPWLGLAFIAVAPLRWRARQRGAGVVPAWLRVPLVFVLVAAVILHYGNLFGRDAGSALGCGLLMLKLLESERVRDARAVLGFAAFVLMSALLFSQTLGFTVLVCLTLVLLLAALNALEPAPLEIDRPWRERLRTGARLVALGLPLAAAGFLFVPRLATPLWGAPGLDAEARTGLSDRMAPGSMTDLLVDDSPALRVKFDTAAPEPAARYFRAIVLWDFDGNAWTRDNAWRRPPTESLESSTPPLGYEITLEPTDHPWLVALDVPLAAADGTRMGSERILSGQMRIPPPRHYRLESTIRYTLAAELDPGDRRRALRLPADFNPRARALAMDWRAQSADDVGVIERALALFRAEFTYTLSAPLLGRDSVDDFLFSTRAGFCEHYSSAFVFLMRAAGIPARVVTGYQGGWHNPLGDYLLVRNSDAHAWAEVWLAGRGWVRVDPTAAVSPERVQRGADGRGGSGDGDGWWRNLRNQLDVVNRLWTQTIVQFNALRQQSLLTPFGIDKANRHDLLLALAVIVSLVLGAATLWVVRTGRARRGDPLDEAWRALQAKGLRAGFALRAGEGPIDYRQRLRDAGVDAAAVLVDEFVTLRYAHAEPPAERVRDFVASVRALRLPRAPRKVEHRQRNLTVPRP